MLGFDEGRVKKMRSKEGENMQGRTEVEKKENTFSIDWKRDSFK